ncbi:hypothetical protein RsS62_64300 [Rhizobium dioscoreae]|uniref:hypothetical protein n=1 Tax=Rhizobium dioscoreae TaxID=2653122 RepID=UPI001260E0A3|nr:hypothetical protein [Rhizobium dioscoreae]GES47178.1 hypothetical protein RsS62_64300 [Rhizobium dioscoreae]
MSRAKKNESARELWEQVLSRLAAEPDATMWDPNYDDAADRERMRDAYAKAGWSLKEIEERDILQEELISNAPVTSPGVNRHVEGMLARLCDDVEAAMDRLKMDSHAKVARGVEPRSGPFVSMINVIMTDESIVTVGSFLFRFCGVVAKAFTRTLQINPFFWESTGYSSQAAQRYLRENPEILRYWMEIYVSFAITGTNAWVPFRPARRTELILFEQIARAMELFGIAHEYGHHSYQHGRDIGSDPHQEEFQADQFALKVSYEIEMRPLLAENPYLSSGAGGVILLAALDTLRSIGAVTDDKKNSHLDSHPPTGSRIERFDSVAIMRPEEFAALKNFRVVSARIMSAVELELLDSMQGLNPHLRDLANSIKL